MQDPQIGWLPRDKIAERHAAQRGRSAVGYAVCGQHQRYPVRECFKRPNFEDLTPIFPDKRYTLEYAQKDMDLSIRLIDLVAPIGMGQRGLIVAPPKAGKTTILKKIANRITENYPDTEMLVLLIDERPEEVTDMQRSIRGDVIYSTFDERPEKSYPRFRNGDRTGKTTG